MKLLLSWFFCLQLAVSAGDLVFGSSANPVLTSTSALVPKSIVTVTNGESLKVTFGASTNNPYRFLLISTNFTIKSVQNGPFMLSPSDFLEVGEPTGGYPYQLHTFGTTPTKVYRILNAIHGQITLQLKL